MQNSLKVQPHLYCFINDSVLARALCAQGALDHKRLVPQRINQLGPRPMRVTPSFFRMHRAIKPSQGQQGTKGCLGFGLFKCTRGRGQTTRPQLRERRRSLESPPSVGTFAIIVVKKKDKVRASFVAKSSSLLLCISLCFGNGRPHIEEDSQAVQRGRQWRAS